MEIEQKGCSSHACIVAPPKGVGTNSNKCFCPEWKIRRYIAGLKADHQQAIAELEQKVTELTAEVATQGGYWGKEATRLAIELARLRGVVEKEAQYCYGYAEKYAGTDELRAARHRERGDRLMRELQESGRAVALMESTP